MHATFDSLYNEFAMFSFAKQMRLADAHGQDRWTFKMECGELTFNDLVTYKTQILGSEDANTGTWLWAWANKSSDISETLLRAAHELRLFGEQHRLSEFVDAELPLECVNGHTIALVASGFCNAQAYFCCSYEATSLFVLIVDGAITFREEDKLVRLLSIIPQAIASLDLQSHRSAIAAYLRREKIDFEENSGSIVIPQKERGFLIAQFDEHDRLVNLVANKM